MIRVQAEDFSLAHEYSLLNKDKSDGAVVTFVGKVRDFNAGNEVTQLTLEHYPGMTEAVLNHIEAQARSRWSLNLVSMKHRVGTLDLGDQIVFIGVTSQHRKAAFDACEFLIDFLKTQAPFWKVETNGHARHWVEAKVSDDLAVSQWDKD